MNTYILPLTSPAQPAPLTVIADQSRSEDIRGWTQPAGYLSHDRLLIAILRNQNPARCSYMKTRS